jgi:spore coat protein X
VKKMSERKWRALDHCNDNDNNNADVTQGPDQVVQTEQASFEWIIIKDSEAVEVHTTDTQVALSLQAAIQAAIAVVISITVGDSETGKAVVQDLRQFFRSRQRNSQKTHVEGSKNVTITTTDTQVAVNIQAMLQILVAIVAKLDIL